MKFKIQKEKLLKGINSVINALPVRTTDPVLQGMLLDAKDKKLKLTATDLDIAIEYVIDGDLEILNEGAIVVQASTFSEIIRRMPEIDITIEVDKEGILKIECKGLKYQLSTISSDEYPKIPQVDLEDTLTIEQRVLKNMIKQTAFAVSNDDKRKLYTGSLINVDKESVTVVSLDGFRLAIRKAEKTVTENNDKEFKVIIPGKYLNEVAKILDESFDFVKLGVKDNQAIFELENCKIITKILEGDFLNYETLMESQETTKVKVNKNILLDAFERVDLITAVKEKKEPVTIDIKIDKMNLSCVSGIGNANEEIVVETEGEDCSLKFNSKYFLDVLRNIEDEEILINFSTVVSPCIIKPVDKTEKFTYIILPLRASN